jgi:hypothetical protein
LNSQDPITDKGKASKKGRLTVQRAEETQGREEARALPRKTNKVNLYTNNYKNNQIDIINGHFRNLNWRYLPYIRPM